jgi:NitT/TauT family transport system ATP-binding protein
VDYIYKIMTQPQLALAVPGATAAAQTSVRQKYQMIPHARVGGIAGLLELLQDRGGKEYLHRLAEVLIMDAEDLLPIVEAAVLLGFATLKEGDVQITAEGARFAQADILTRKILFRQAALNHVVILQQIDRVLHAKADHSIPEEFFYDILDEHFSEDEVRRQFETAMNWGRYAEIFDFDRESHRLVLAEPAGEPHPPTTTPVQL